MCFTIYECKIIQKRIPNPRQWNTGSKDLGLSFNIWKQYKIPLGTRVEILYCKKNYSVLEEVKWKNKKNKDKLIHNPRSFWAALPLGNLHQMLTIGRVTSGIGTITKGSRTSMNMSMSDSKAKRYCMQKEWEWKLKLETSKENKSEGEGRKQSYGCKQVNNKRPWFRAHLNEGLEGEWMEFLGHSKWLSSST